MREGRGRHRPAAGRPADRPAVSRVGGAAGTAPGLHRHRRTPCSGSGTELVVQLPRHPGAVADVAHEQRWLPRLGPLLPVATPEPLGLGEPDADFPWPWSVYRWLDGAEPGRRYRRGAGAARRGPRRVRLRLTPGSTHGGPAAARGVPLSPPGTSRPAPRSHSSPAGSEPPP
ncbi:phosphotransferase [Streptomyces tricolor]|nr:phosphotransferase [Streptomyces tricolor]